MRRIGSALFGGLLVAAAVYEASAFGRDAYYSYHVFPKYKDLYIALASFGVAHTESR